MPMKLNLWAEEQQKFFSIRYKVKETLFSQKSPFQQVDVVETEGFGKMLLNDSLVMITEKDEFIYHDMITHVPLFTHPEAKNVLIIGGGDGGTAREVIRHPEVKKCTMVEIDELVVKACKEFIPQTAKALSDPKVNLVIEDGVEFVAKSKDKFDVIIIDSTDPIGPATPLFGEDFYKNIKKILNNNGIVVAQGESPFYNKEMQMTGLKIFNKFFKHVHIYNFSNLTYPGGYWSFWYGSNELCPIGDFNPQRVKDSKLKFSYYNPAIHKASFVLPEFMKNNLNEFLTEFKTKNYE